MIALGLYVEFVFDVHVVKSCNKGCMYIFSAADQLG